MIVKPNTSEDEVLDNTLRPQKWEEYIGQEQVKRNVKVIIEAAKQRNEPPEHLLFYGSSGLGKTTLAYLIAKELNVEMKITSGPAIERPGDLAAILTNLKEGQILFIDEIHRLNRTCEELIYPALEDYKLNIIVGKGPMARTLEIKLPKFTLIGATTRIAQLTSPLRNRFGAIFQLKFYTVEEIGQIIERSATFPGPRHSKVTSSNFSPSISPAPLLIALSIFSFGILNSFAISMAILSFGFVSGSFPSLAAIAICRLIFEKILALFLSSSSFLYLIPCQ